MTTKITIEIVADEAGYTPQEQAILAAVQGTAPTTVVNVAAPAIDMTAKTKEAADARIAESRAKTAADAKTKAAADAKAKAAAEAKEAKEAAAAAADEEVVPDDQAIAEEAAEEDDLLGGGTTFTKAEAIAKATQLVSTQKQAIVKKALAAVGAKRVSDLNDDADIQTFMAELEA